MLRVAVIGGGPSGSCAAEILAKAGIKTWLFERKLDNAKPCGGAIPLCMVEEFDLPESIIDRKVRPGHASLRPWRIRILARKSGSPSECVRDSQYHESDATSSAHRVEFDCHRSMDRCSLREALR